MHTHAACCLLSSPSLPAGQLARLAREEAERRASEPHPLCEYFDDELHLADLAAFDQAQRMTVEGNGEADVLIGAVDVDVPLASCSVAGLQVHTNSWQQLWGPVCCCGGIIRCHAALPARQCLHSVWGDDDDAVLCPWSRPNGGS